MSTFHFKDHLLSFIGDKHSGKNFILDKGVPFNIYKEYVNSFHKNLTSFSKNTNQPQTHCGLQIYRFVRNDGNGN